MTQLTGGPIHYQRFDDRTSGPQATIIIYVDGGKMIALFEKG